MSTIAVSLSSTPPAPRVPGTPVTLTASASGGSGSYEYQYFQKINGQWKIVRPYSTEPGWTWDTTGVATGTHYFNIYARNVGSKSLYETTGFLGYTLVPPAQKVTTQVSPPAPRVPGTPVTLTAGASGGSGSYEYLFYQKINGQWKIVRPYSTESSWTWDTTGVATGTHYFNIYARNVGSKSLYETTGFLGYTLVPPAQKVTTQVSPPAPRVPGTPVTLTASASGGSGSYEYLFYQKINGQWKIVRPYSTESSWMWDTRGVATGTHYFNIYARNVGSKSLYETTGFLGYTLVPPPPANEVTVSITPNTPQFAGTPITFTSYASGGSGQYEYQYYRHLNGQWTIVQPYSSASSWTWDTTGAAPGDHYFTVYARSVGSTALYDVARFGVAKIIPKPATGVTLTATPGTPQLPGTPIAFSAAASGGSGRYEYQFYRKINGQWTVVQPYSATSSWTWDTTDAAPGLHYFTVYARSVGSTALYDVAHYIIARVLSGPVTILSDINAVAAMADNLWGPVPSLRSEAQTWQSSQQHYYELITDYLGYRRTEDVPLDVRIVSEEDQTDHIRRKILYQVEPGEWAPAYLLIPKGVTFPRPAVIAMHQSSPVGKNEVVGIEGDPDMFYGLELVRRGYVVLAPDTISAGERLKSGETPFYSVSFTQMRPTWSAEGKMLWDHQRGVDYLLTLPEVDAANIGAIGHSLGGTNALFLAAFDNRIKALVHSGSYSRNDIDPNKLRWNYYIPQLRPYINGNTPLPWDMQNVISLIAPRPMFQFFALRDQMFPPVPFSEVPPSDFISLSVSVAQIHNAVLPFYQQTNNEALLQTRYYDGSHGFPTEARDAAYVFFESNLIGNPPSQPLQTPEIIITEKSGFSTIALQGGSQNVIIRYRTNTSPDWLTYDGVITINESCAIFAYALESGKLPSPVVERTVTVQSEN